MAKIESGEVRESVPMVTAFLNYVNAAEDAALNGSANGAAYWQSKANALRDVKPPKGQTNPVTAYLDNQHAEALALYTQSPTVLALSTQPA